MVDEESETETASRVQNKNSPYAVDSSGDSLNSPSPGVCLDSSLVVEAAIGNVTNNVSRFELSGSLISEGAVTHVKLIDFVILYA